ncbi:MAG TPA: PQQ-binding-like beta-propeller repeat protein, partial [Ktedonobacterales bacterium]|nr:PQQ-binding-like beta-propeller repeat protein [Ktedonobacterales bacterium]
ETVLGVEVRREGGDTAMADRMRGAAPLPLLLVPLLLASIVLPGCASNSSAKSTPTPPQYLLYLLDGNFASATHAQDVRYSVVALDRRDGQRVWRHPLGTPQGNGAVARFKPVAQNGLVYVSYEVSNAQMGNTQGVLEALDPATGRTRSRHEVGNSLEGEPVMSGGGIYLSAHIYMTQGVHSVQSGLVQALDAQTGTLRWQRALDDVSSLSMPAVSGSLVMVVFGSSAGAQVGVQAGAHLVTLSAQDGTVRWDYAADAPISRGDDAFYEGSTAPLVLGQLVYARAPENYPNGDTHVVLLAVHARDGSFAWQYDTGGSATPGVSQSGDTLCVSEYHINPAHTGILGSVTGVATATGSVRWHVTGFARVSACVAAGAAFYLGEQALDSTAGALVALGSPDGRQLWQTPIPTAPIELSHNRGLSPPTISDDLVVACLEPAFDPSRPVQTSVSSMVALGLGDGTLRWHADVAGVALGLPEIDGDQIVVHEGSFGAGATQLVAAYALQTGTHQWTYTLGQV